METATLEKIVVRELRRKDLAYAEAISELFQTHLGKNYTSAEETGAMMRARSAWVFGAFAHGELIGAATASNADRDTIDDLNEWGARLGRRAQLLPVNARRVGMLDSSVVADEFRGQGVGLELVRQRTQFLAEHGKSHVVALSWASGAKHASAGVLARAGFKHVFTIPKYWEDDTLYCGYECVKCGRRCVCDAKVYVKKTVFR